MAHTYNFNVEKGSSAASIGSTSSKWKLNGNIREVIELTIDLASSDGATKVISDSRITPKHVVLQSVVIDPASQA